VRTQVMVLSERSEAWAVEVAGDPTSRRRFRELRSARRYARSVAVERIPSEVRVVDLDGSLRERSLYVA
jgi:hypothetical protein